MDDHRNCNADAATEGCAESRLLMSRRAMLGVTTGLFSWAFMPRFAEAASSNGPRLLMVVLRGGVDGLNTVVPFGDNHYVSMRGGIAIPATSTIRLNSFFGLHPALKKFGGFYKNGDASVIHATCVPLRNRSHFDAQDNLESGLPGRAASNTTGWLNRLLMALPAGAPLKSAGAIQIGEAPVILRGPAPVLGWSASRYASIDNETLQIVRTLYEKRDPMMSRNLALGLKANRLANRLDQNDGDISPLRKGFRGAGRLLAAPDGPRIAFLSVDGFDTHSEQGGLKGEHTRMLTDLDSALGDFRTSVGAAWQQTVVVLATEFGRTVRINGDRGTDHGVGTVTLLAGGAVNGGKMFGDWPGLAPRQLFEGSDLRATTDLRSVFKGVLLDHIGVPPKLLSKAIFPESGHIKPFGNLIRSNAPHLSGAAVDVPVKIESGIAAYRRAQGGA